MPVKGVVTCPNPNCGSTWVMTRVDGTIFCRKCGYDTRKKEQKGEKT